MSIGVRCLYIHNRRRFGPRVSSWFTFHHISEELKRRGHLLAAYSVDYDMTNDDGESITDKVWLRADCLFTVFRDAEGPLLIAEQQHIPSFLEINYACSQIANAFMRQELLRLGFGEDELMYEQSELPKRILSLPTYIVGAGNSYTEETYRDFGVKRVKMFRAGIDTEHFVPDFSRRGEDRIRFTFTAASLNFRKGITYVAEAWESLPAAYHESIELHLFGKLPYGTGTKKAVDRLFAFSNVIHHGFLSNSEEAYISAHAMADCMLCPTLAEGQSATALEGMSFGLFPIVSPYTGSDFEAVPSWVLSGDPTRWNEELREGIMHVVDNYSAVRRDMPTIREHASTNYRWSDFRENVVTFMEQVYEERS